MVTRIFIAACALLLLAAMPSMGQAQDGGGGGPGGGPGPDGNGPPDFNQMRQRFEQQLKQQLGVSDAEWTALQPKIEAVQNQMRDLRPPRPPFGPGSPGGPGGPGGPGDGQGPPGGPGDKQGGPVGGPGGPGGPGGEPPPENDSSSPVHQAMRNLVDAVNSPDSKPEQVKAALQAERAARAKATADLAKARDELQQVVTPKQEALLVTMGILE